MAFDAFLKIDTSIKNAGTSQATAQEQEKIEDLADMAGMGVSTLHHHFRTMTSMSPLQYQKHLRLHEARRILLGENVDA
ncbi:MAG: AraC family transcriptional regulator [Azoarcus sp.]|jgi:AraC-like DNA-binding protein|nr:AraC family transcriptional regulator [Azoarcus sp.]